MVANDTPRSARVRWRAVAAVALLHLAAIVALVHAFAPDFTARVTEGVVEAVTVTITAPSPQPSSQPTQAAPEGASGEAGRKADPAPIAAPRPRVAVAIRPAPPVAGAGAAAASGARDSGAGTGAGGPGAGTGSGGGGLGTGGGMAAKPVKIAGDISAARDYPEKTRELRLGDYVIVALTVGTDGRVEGCRIVRASRDAEADRITCRLATERFRFRPAMNAAGAPVESVYGWRQRWYDPRPRTEQAGPLASESATP